MTDEVLSERRGGVRLLVLNRPDSMNAVNATLATALGERLQQASIDPSVRAIVITGAGNRAFCAGMDLKAYAKGEAPLANGHPEWGFAGFIRHFIDKPVIAAVNGVALGGGAEMVLAADLAVAGVSALLGFPEVKRGIVAGGGGVIRLQRQIPRKFALEAVLTGAPFAAARAHELGLINRIVDDHTVLDEALMLAGQIAENAPLAVQASKCFVREADRFGSDWDDDIWNAHDAALAPVFASEDAREGARAFAQRRPPVWTGR